MPQTLLKVRVWASADGNNSIKARGCPRSVRDKLGGRPYDVISESGKYTLRFFPQAPHAKNPDTVLFRVTLTKDDLKKLCKLSS